MKIGDLVEQLQKFDPNLPISIWRTYSGGSGGNKLLATDMKFLSSQEHKNGQNEPSVIIDFYVET